jgi:hypothetical protein
MLAARIEQVARARLDDAAEAVPVQQAGQRLGARNPTLRHRVEVVVVQRERDAGIARIGDEGDGILQPVVGGAVGVEGEA